MGLNAFFTFHVVLAMGVPARTALGRRELPPAMWALATVAACALAVENLQR